jgi:ribosomal protein S18 acetylase RimI-like enzyme
VEIRERRATDIARVVDIAREVHRLDGYPVYLPRGDFERFLLRPTSVVAFVAVAERRLVGHVAVNESTSDAAMGLLASLTQGRPLGVVARLLVDPTARRAGVARELLRHAANWSLTQGRVPVLDVVAESLPAVGLYRAEGWIEVGEIELDLPGLTVRELVFAHPSVDAAGLTIRDAAPADHDAIGGIFERASLSNEGDREDLLAHPEVLTFDASYTRSSRVRVAVVGAQIVGFATTRRLDDTAVELDDLFVDPDWMRRGVARALLSDAVAAAKQQHASRIEVSANVHAMAFYEAVGFVTIGSVETRFGPTPRMHLEIGE